MIYCLSSASLLVVLTILINFQMAELVYNKMKHSISVLFMGDPMEFAEGYMATWSSIRAAIIKLFNLVQASTHRVEHIPYASILECPWHDNPQWLIPHGPTNLIEIHRQLTSSKQLPLPAESSNRSALMWESLETVVGSLGTHEGVSIYIWTTEKIPEDRETLFLLQSKGCQVYFVFVTPEHAFGFQREQEKHTYTSTVCNAWPHCHFISVVSDVQMMVASLLKLQLQPTLPTRPLSLCFPQSDGVMGDYVYCDADLLALDTSASSVLQAAATCKCHKMVTKQVHTCVHSNRALNRGQINPHITIGCLPFQVEQEALAIPTHLVVDHVLNSAAFPMDVICGPPIALHATRSTDLEWGLLQANAELFSALHDELHACRRHIIAHAPSEGTSLSPYFALFPTEQSNAFVMRHIAVGEQIIPPSGLTIPRDQVPDDARRRAASFLARTPEMDFFALGYSAGLHALIQRGSTAVISSISKRAAGAARNTSRKRRRTSKAALMKNFQRR